MADPRAGTICITIMFDESADEKLMARVIGTTDPGTGFIKDTEEILSRNAFALAGLLAQGFKQKFSLRKEAIKRAAKLMGLQIEIMHDDYEQFEDALEAIERANPSGDDPSIVALHCRACDECNGHHHFSESTLKCADGNETHPAALAGHEMWFACKHCDAWAEIDDTDDGGEEGDLVPGTVHEAPVTQEAM